MIRTQMFQLSERPVPCCDDDPDMADHLQLTERFKKTLYFSKTPKIERPSLPLTEMAVELCQDAAKRELDKVDTDVAASIGRQACISPCSMVLGMVYIERLKKRNPNYLRKVSSSDLFLISMMMASKFTYDEGVDEEVFNDEWAESANMDVDDVNNLEIDFLTAMDWGLFVGRKEFLSALLTIEKRIALGQGMDRNWFSYTDLWVLFQDPKYKHLWQEIKKELTQVFFACSLSYLAGLLTMVGSVVALSYVTAGIPMAATLLSTVHTPAVNDVSSPQQGFKVLPSVNKNSFAAEDLSIEHDYSDSGLPNEITAADIRSSALGENDVSSGVNSSNSSPKSSQEQPRFQSGFRPFLAVMTLKNALMNFVSAVGSSDGQRGGNSDVEEKLSPFDCAKGTCHGRPGMKTTCLNTTVPHHTNAASYPITRKQGARSCCGQCRRILASQSHPSHKTSVTCHPTVVTNSLKSGYAEFRCCCQHVTDVSNSWKLQNDAFPDIMENMGFHTRTLAPLVAVT